MDGTLHVSARVLGRRKRLLDDWSIPLSPEFADDGEPVTLRELIIRVVTETVRAFERRQEQNKFVRALTQRQIDEGLQRGRVDPGGRDLEQQVDVEAAIGSALQAFEDGVYLVIIDGEEQRQLDAQIFVKPDSQITFLRLVMLAGG